MNEIRKIDDDFSDFSVSKQIASKACIKHGNVIKHTIKDTSVIQSEPQPQLTHLKPEIIVHREDEMITRIEFICSCGQRSEVHFDYDGS